MLCLAGTLENCLREIQLIILSAVRDWELLGTVLSRNMLVHPLALSNKLADCHPKFLMDEHLAFLKPDNVSLEEAATIGVGILVSPYS
jgi:hypothetical protein